MKRNLQLSFMKSITFSLILLFAATSTFAQVVGTWKLAPTAQALAVGPTQGDFSWWSNSAGDVTTRACLFDDKFVFAEDGTFTNIQDGETWLEGWQGMDPEGCGASVAPHDGSNAATWAYDEAAGTITLTGVGAHLGLAKVTNSGELAAPSAAPASITYPVVIDGNTMTVDINFGGGFWHFVFEKETAIEPETSPLSGTTWKLAPTAQALAVGPTQGDFSWWSNNAGDVTTRACLFDDQFVFAEDGTFTNVQDGETWLEGWQGMDPEGCGASVAPHDGSNAATWSYDEAAGTVTLTGVGAHLGLAKVTNSGELTAPSAAPASITYPVVFEDNTMTVDIDFGGGFWHFVFQKEGTTTPDPDPEPVTSNVTFGVDMSGYDGTFTQVYVSGSLNGWAGDANPLADEDGDGVWTGVIALAAGDYDFKFTLDNWAAQEEFQAGAPCTATFGDNNEFVNRVITVSADMEICFNWNTCDACGTGVDPEPVVTEGLPGTWKLAPIAGALAVGPTQGDFSWWSNSAGDVATRACLFDDKFVFAADGTFSNVQDGSTWLEPWQGVAAEGCAAPVAPHDGSNAATWAFDETAGTITLTGVGAHLGLAKVNNSGELMSPAAAPASITYPAVIENGIMTVDIDFGGGFWHFVFEKQAETPPAPEPTGLIGSTWKLAPMAQALAVGPTKGDFSWWSNSEGDVTTRACLFDDKFVFNADGTFNNVQDGETWLEGWQGMDPEGCGASVAPHDGSNAATWSYDEAAGTVTLTGVGAHLGLAKVTNGGELAAPSAAPASITYPVVVDGNTMTVDIDFGGGFWHFVFERESTTSTIEVAQEDLFSFFPNPASGQIQIRSEEVIDELIIHDITGKVVVMQNKPSSNETVDVSNLTSGLYIIQVRVGHKISVEKLSIK